MNFSGFPVVDEILTQVEKAVKGEEVAKVTTSRVANFER
jgi:hypothetical protein